MSASSSKLLSYCVHAFRNRHVCSGPFSNGAIKTKPSSLSVKDLSPQNRDFSSTKKYKSIISQWFARESATSLENPWDFNLWNPTSLERPEFISKQNFYDIAGKIQNFTRNIYRSPYDAGIWRLRGAALAKLGYPDLAAGDLYKASLLLEGEDAMFPGGNILIMGGSLDAEELTQFRYDVHSTLIATLLKLKDTLGLQQICEKAEKTYPSESPLKKEFQKLSVLLAAVQKQEKDAGVSVLGAVFHKAYPFLPSEYLIRNKALIQSTQKAFKIISSSCELLPSRLRTQSVTISDKNSISSSSSSENFFGVFATRDIARNELILKESTVLGAAYIAPLKFKGREVCGNCYCTIRPRSTEKVSSGCCSEVYCSEHCKTLALDFYHKVLCQQNFRWLLDEDHQDTSLSSLMWLRTLAICVQSGCHPLDNPQIARLTPQYEGFVMDRWSLGINIIQPIRILLQLGIDVFRDPRYDTWALQAVRARLVNNSYRNVTGSGKPIRGVAALYSFFNHSCEPSAWHIPPDDAGTSITLTAKRAIRKGEEIFISYVEPTLNIKERQQKLRGWLGGHNCRCPKCQRGN